MAKKVNKKNVEEVCVVEEIMQDFICRKFWCKTPFKKFESDPTMYCPKCMITCEDDMVVDNGYKTYKADKPVSKENFKFNVENLSDKYFKKGF